MPAPTPTMKPAGDPSSKPRPLNYASPIPIRDRIGRHLPSREQVVNFLKNLVWVAPLTLLIWVYAEREQTVTLGSVTFPIEVRTTDHNKLVTLRKPQDKNIVVELSGPRARLDRIGELLKPGRDSQPVEIYVDPKMSPPGQELLTIAQINNYALFKNNGITVKSAQPPYIYVAIDSFEDVDVPVKAPPDVEKQLTDQTYFVPSTVKVRAPSQLIEAARQGNGLAVYADVSKRDEFKTKTGQVKLENVPLYWVVAGREQREHVTIAPLTITANLDVKPRDKIYEIKSVPVYKETPAGFDDRFVVQYNATVSNVKVSGPEEEIAKIIDGSFKVKARVEVSSLDATDRPIRKPLKFDLPPGVYLQKDANKYELEYTVTERK
jgi:hypothetical protein